MAGASPLSSYGLGFLCIYYFTLVLCIPVVPASAFSIAFNFSTAPASPCGNDLQCRGAASLSNHVMELTRNDITSNSEHSVGRVWYARPVPLWDAATGELASFNTSFTFMITPDNRFYTNPNTGDGMAFFLAPYSTNDVLSSGDGGVLGKCPIVPNKLIEKPLVERENDPSLLAI
ncbi:hypothetical protein EJB05_42718, partial [Eragrostis curvula]